MPARYRARLHCTRQPAATARRILRSGGALAFDSFRRQAVKIELRQLAHSSKLPPPKGRRSTSVVAIGGGGGGSSLDVCDTAVQCERNSQDTAQLRSVASRIQVVATCSHVGGARCMPCSAVQCSAVLCRAVLFSAVQRHMLLVLRVQVVR